MTETATRPHTRSRVPVLVAGAVLGLLGAGYVGVRDPHDAGVAMPVCPFHWATGLDCPGCGGLRMTHDLLHGDLAAAFADNAVLLILAPLLLVVLGRAAWRWSRRRPAGINRRIAWALLAVGVVWTVARNLTG